MLKIGPYVLAILIISLQSCSAKAESKDSTEEIHAEVKSYQFAEDEYIHWEAYLEGDFVVVKAWLNNEWNTYSVYNTNFPGPLPTLITFQETDEFELVGKIQEEGLKTKFDNESESDIGYFKDVATFKQKIKPISGEEFVLTGNVNYMICNSTTCLPPEDFTFELAIKP